MKYLILIILINLSLFARTDPCPTGNPPNAIWVAGSTTENIEARSCNHVTLDDDACTYRYNSSGYHDTVYTRFHKVERQTDDSTCSNDIGYIRVIINNYYNMQCINDNFESRGNSDMGCICRTYGPIVDSCTDNGGTWNTTTCKCDCNRESDLENDGYVPEPEYGECIGMIVPDEILQKTGSTNDKKYLQSTCGCPDADNNAMVFVKLNPDYDPDPYGCAISDPNSHSGNFANTCVCNTGYYQNTDLDICQTASDYCQSKLPNSTVNYLDGSNTEFSCLCSLPLKKVNNGTTFNPDYACQALDCDAESQKFIQNCPYLSNNEFHCDSAAGILQNDCNEPQTCNIDCEAEEYGILQWCEHVDGNCTDTPDNCQNNLICLDSIYDNNNSSSSSSSSLSNDDKCIMTDEIWNGRECICKEGYYKRPTSLYCHKIPSDLSDTNNSKVQDYNNYIQNPYAPRVTKQEIQRALEDALENYGASTKDNQQLQLQEANRTNSLIGITNDTLTDLLNDSNKTNNILQNGFDTLTDLLTDINKSEYNLTVSLSSSDNQDSNNTDNNNSNDNNVSEFDDDKYISTIQSFYDSWSSSFNELNSTISNIVSNGFSIDALPTSTVNSCSVSKVFDLPDPINDITFNVDICSVLAPVYPIFYFIFYIIFFVSGLSLTASIIMRILP